MSLTKSSTVVHNSITLTAGAGDTTSSDQDLSASYQHTARIRITNGGTGPTVPAQCKILISEDTTSGNFITLATIKGDTANSAVVEQVVTIPDTATYVRFVSGSNTGQNVTLRVVLDKITAY